MRKKKSACSVRNDGRDGETREKSIRCRVVPRFRRKRRPDHRTNPKIHTNQYTKLATKALRRSSQLNPGESPWEASSAGTSHPGDSGTTSTYHPQFLVSTTKGTTVAAPATIATTGIEHTNMITTWLKEGRRETEDFCAECPVSLTSLPALLWRRQFGRRHRGASGRVLWRRV